MRHAIVFLLLIFSIPVSAQTDWSIPEVIYDTEETSYATCFSPQIATGVNGKLALAWHVQHGEDQRTSFTFGRKEIRYISDTLASYSSDGGMNWTSPDLMSDPRVRSSQVTVSDGGVQDEFLFSWTSGDSISGFRHHTAQTSNLGDSYTSSVLHQRYMDPDVGYFYPRIERVGPYEIMVYEAFWANGDTHDIAAGVAARPIGADQWTTASMIHSDAIPNTRTIVRSTQPMAISENVVMVPLSLTNASNQQTPKRAALYISRDYGQSWELQLIPPMPGASNNYTGQIVTDKKGSWHVFWRAGDPVAGVFPIYSQTSTDEGRNWTSPTVVFSAFSQNISTVCTDGNGRWILSMQSDPESATGKGRYVWSDDNGVTWSDRIELPEILSGYNYDAIAYVGNGRWVWVWADNRDRFLNDEFAKIKMSTLVWGQSLVDEWSIY